MCSILGSLGTPINFSEHRAAMQMRGPDDYSSYSHKNLNIVHSRLAVIGASSTTAKQPLRSADKKLFCNGFISNYMELFKEKNIGSSESDCAAILDVYQKFGVAGFGLLRGQFAAALIDPKRNKLIILRDACGIIPFYFRIRNNSLNFSSQAAWLESTSIDVDAFEEVEALGFTTGSRTLLSEIQEVPPGFALEFDLDAPSNYECYPFFTFSPTEAPKGSLEIQTRSLLQQAVRRNLLSDSQPWLIFSGGLDSTLLLHCCVVEGFRPRLLSLEYTHKENRLELEHAAEVAKYYGCSIETVPFVTPSQDDVIQFFRSRIDWPYDGGSLLPKLALAEKLRAKPCKVVMGGSGADELFGGYRRHAARLELYAANKIGNSDAEKTFFNNYIGKYKISPQVYEAIQKSAAKYNFADPGFFYDLMELRQLHNPRLDSCFANSGLEYRPVFEDQDLVSHAAALPLDLKSEQKNPKSLLKRAFASEVSSKFLCVEKSPLRFGKMGPIESWKTYLMDLWLSARELKSEKEKIVYATSHPS